MDKKKIAFLIFCGVIALIISFFLSGVLVLVLNKVGFMKFFKIWHYTFILDAIANGYPKTYPAILISLFFTFGGVTILALLVKKVKAYLVKQDLRQ